MAHFRGTVRGARKEASRLGTAHSGLRVEAQSWQGKVVVVLRSVNGVDYAEVTLAQHNGAGSLPRELYYGPVSGEPSFAERSKALLDGAERAVREG